MGMLSRHNHKLVTREEEKDPCMKTRGQKNPSVESTSKGNIYKHIYLYKINVCVLYYLNECV